MTALFIIGITIKVIATIIALQVAPQFMPACMAVFMVAPVFKPEKSDDAMRYMTNPVVRNGLRAVGWLSAMVVIAGLWWPW